MKKQRFTVYGIRAPPSAVAESIKVLRGMATSSKRSLDNLEVAPRNIEDNTASGIQ